MAGTTFEFSKLWIILAISWSRTKSDDQELRLLKYLMGNYDPAVRPTAHFSEPLIVSFSLSLHQIIDVDEKNQILTTNCWLTQIWTDHHLQWNSTEFGGIQFIRVPYTRVWRPDIILYNNADPGYSSSVINTNVIVTQGGQVTWLSHGIYKSSCDINVEFFPFDVQNCTMKWSSWTFDGYLLDLQMNENQADTSNYHANGEFDLLGFSAVRNVEIYSCCPEPYPDVTFGIVLKRRPMFYVFNLIIPCLLINCIALLVFFVPSDSGEKVTLGISALLSMTVFLMTIRESLPPTEKTPLISLYYGVSICIVTSASAMAVLTLSIHHRGFRGVPVPGVVGVIVSWLGKVLLLQKEAKDERGSMGQTKSELHSQLDDLHPTLGHRLDAQSTMRKVEVNGSPRFGQGQDHFSPDRYPNHSQLIGQRLLLVSSKISDLIDKLEERTLGQGRQEALVLEWKKIALVVDRFLFVVFTVTTLISTIVVLFSSPHGPSLFF